MEDKLICKYCGKEIPRGEEVRNSHTYEPDYKGEPVWHSECYLKESDEAWEHGNPY